MESIYIFNGFPLYLSHLPRWCPNDQYLPQSFARPIRHANPSQTTPCHTTFSSTLRSSYDSNAFIKKSYCPIQAVTRFF